MRTAIIRRMPGRTALVPALAAVACLMLAACDRNAGQAPLVGQLESDRIELRAEFAEPVVERPMQEGEAVAAGDVIVAQDRSRQLALLAEADARRAELKARLDEMLRGPRAEQIRAARAQVNGASRNEDLQRLEFERARDVFEKGLTARETLDRATTALDTASAELDARNAQLEELLAGTTVEELRQVERQLDQAAARADKLRIDLNRLSLTAPTAGQLDVLLFETGETPMPGEAVAVLLSGEQPHARVYVPEALRAHVRPGTSASVRIDGIAGSIPGRVRWVSGDAAFTPYFALTEHDRGRLTFEAKIDLQTDGQRLPDGVPVEVELDLPAERH